MMKRLLHKPDAIRNELRKVFQRRQLRWLRGEGAWPLEVPLGLPKEAIAISRFSEVTQWIQAWKKHSDRCELLWVRRQWVHLGIHDLPYGIRFNDAQGLAQWIGELAIWKQMVSRYGQMQANFSGLSVMTQQHLPLLKAYSEEDFERLQRVLGWFIAHPHSQQYLRQLPIRDVDSKWIEVRQGLIKDLLLRIQEPSSVNKSMDFYRLTGLKKEPALVRFRVLDPLLSQSLGNLTDLSVPVNELRLLTFRPRYVFIVENLRTGLAFTALADTVVIMQLGYAVTLLKGIPWLNSATCYYWGDIDTHGFAILHAARSVLPHLQSLLMNEQSLLHHRAQWVKEKKPALPVHLDKLTEEELTLYHRLKENHWGEAVRLEQERMDWSYAWQKIGEVAQ